MKIEYKLTNDDFLEFQLYTASKSKTIEKKRRFGRIIIPLLYFGIAAYSLINDSVLFGIILLVFGLIWFVFYPRYSKYRYKRHYKNHIAEHYQNRVNITEELIFEENFVFSKDNSSEAKIEVEEFEYLIELKAYFFLTLKRGISFIIPKSQVTDVMAFKNKIEKLGIQYVNELEWEWH